MVVCFILHMISRKIIVIQLYKAEFFSLSLDKFVLMFEMNEWTSTKRSKPGNSFMAIAIVFVDEHLFPIIAKYSILYCDSIEI